MMQWNTMLRELEARCSETTGIRSANGRPLLKDTMYPAWVHTHTSPSTPSWFVVPNTNSDSLPTVLNTTVPQRQTQDKYCKTRAKAKRGSGQGEGRRTQFGHALSPNEIPLRYGPRWFGIDVSRRELPAAQFCRCPVSSQSLQLKLMRTHVVFLTRARNDLRVSSLVVHRLDVQLAWRVLEVEEVWRDVGHRVVLVRHMREVRDLR